MNLKKLFKFKKEVGWSELISVLALIFAIFSTISQLTSNKPKLSLQNSSYFGTEFIDYNGKKYHFGFYKTTIINNGDKAVTFLGLKPSEETGLIITKTKKTDFVKTDNVPYKIFQIPDEILIDHLIKGKLNISAFKNEGLEKLSIINKVIEPGEVYAFNLGIIIDFYSSKSESYDAFFFTSNLIFSNGDKFKFGTSGNIN